MKIQLKRSNVLNSGVAKEPTSEQMEYGELAVNYSDGDPAIFLKDSNDNIIRIAGEGSVGGILSGDTFPDGVDEGTLFYYTLDNTLYYWNGSSWVAINGDDVYVDVSGDNMTGNLTLGTDKITLNATSGAGAFTGKVTTASTVSGDGGTTVTTKDYVDNNRTVPGSGTLNIKDNTGASLGTFSANATSGTETVISLPASAAPTTPGDGGLTIKNYNDSTAAGGSFTANQATGSTITLKQIKYADVSGTPSIPAPPGAGTLNIKDNTGESLGTFSANATSGTETVISLPASVAPTTPGDGGLTIKNYNDSTAASGSFSANQGTGSTITLNQVKYSDVSGTPSIPSAAGAGTLNIKDNTGTSLGTFNANASTGTETVISLPAQVAPTPPGDGGLTIKNYNDSSAASGSFSANQGPGSTITLKQIKYADVSGTPSIPAAAGNGTITIVQPGVSDQTFTVNQSGNKTITLKNDNTQVTPGSGGLTIKNFNDSSSATGSFNANQSSTSTLTLKQIKYADVSGTPSIPAAANNGALNIKNYNDSSAATGTFTANNSGTGTLTLRQIKYADISGKPSIPSAAGNGTITISQPGVSNQTFTVNQSGNTTITLKNDNTQNSTNLGNSTTTSAVTVTSSTGSNTSIAAATGSKAGVMTTSQVSDLSAAKAGSIKAYCTTTASGSASQSYNISVKLNRSGVYDYTFSPSMPNKNYTVNATIQEISDTGSLAYYCSVQNKSTSGFQVKTWFRQDTPGGGPVNSQFNNQGHGVMVI